MTKLSYEAVDEIMKRVLFTDDEYIGKEPPTDAIRVEGIVNNYAFHPGRIADTKEKIRELLAELPDEFRMDKGGGWTFLNACMDRHGNHWAEHQTIERLFALGIAAGLAKWLLPREMWKALPGGMPYVGVELAA